MPLRGSPRLSNGCAIWEGGHHQRPGGASSAVVACLACFAAIRSLSAGWFHGLWVALRQCGPWAVHLGLLAACAVHAQPALSPQDVAVLAATCATCHGPGGRPPAGAASSISALRGQGSAALLRQMQAFQAGRVAGATVMPLLMQGFDAAQMQALAQWFADPATEPP